LSFRDAVWKLQWREIPSEFDTKITVRVDTTSEAERAANIMEVYGSSNVNKKQGEFF